MAKQYVEIVAQGSFKLLKGFLCGLYLDRWDAIDFFFNRDLNIKARSLLEQIRDRIGIKPELVHFIIEESQVEALKPALAKVEPWLHLQICEVRTIHQASLNFTLSAYTEQDGTRLLNLLKAERPESVELLTCEEREPERRQDAKGVEVYAPLHEYELHVKGTLRGEPAALIRYGWKLMHESLITLEEIELEYENENDE